MTITITITGIQGQTISVDTWEGEDIAGASIAPMPDQISPLDQLTINGDDGQDYTAYLFVGGNGDAAEIPDTFFGVGASGNGEATTYATSAPESIPQLQAELRQLVVQPYPLQDPGPGGVYPGPAINVSVGLMPAADAIEWNSAYLPSMIGATAITFTEKDPPPSPVPKPTPTPHPSPDPTPAAPSYQIVDLTKEQAYTTSGAKYSGTMPGITSEFISPNADSTLIGSSSPGAYLYASGHFNNFYLAQSTGTEMMDGGTSSDLMTGGSGTNYFFADDLNSSGTALVWDTANNFHIGDIAAIWGVTASDSIKWVANTGNPGYLGETVEITAPGKPEVAMDFVGHTLGNLRASFETSGGTPFLRVEAV